MSFDFLEVLIFAVLAIMVVGGGAMVVFVGRITSAALFMALTFLSVAGMFVLLGAETIAAFQVLIYVGAITVLILYGVMFTPQSAREYALLFQRQTPWGAAFAGLVAIPVLWFAFHFTDGRPLPRGGDLVPLATSLFGDFAFLFEVASVLLLAALVGAIVLVKRDDEETP